MFDHRFQNVGTFGNVKCLMIHRSDSLKKICQNLLMHHVDTDSVCRIVKHAETYQAEDLKTYCMSYLLKNFEAIAQSPSFDTLSSSPALLLEVTRMTCNRNARVNF